jgi:predicted phosphodiesterase
MRSSRIAGTPAQLVGCLGLVLLASSCMQEGIDPDLVIAGGGTTIGEVAEAVRAAARRRPVPPRETATTVDAAVADVPVADSPADSPSAPSTVDVSPGAPSGGVFRFAVYGDSRTNPDIHQKVIDQMARFNPDLVVHSGDMWDGYSPDLFRSIISKNPGLGRLLEQGNFVVSRGNHEGVAEYLGFQPTLARGTGNERFSFTAGNSFFVILGMDPSTGVDFLEQELKSAAAQKAAWRFVASHYPIYSGGDHGGSGNPAIEKLCDTYHVAVYWNGHDHIYERSHQIFGQQIVDTSDALVADRGTVYVVAGGGGAPLYNSRKIATTHTNFSTNNFVEVAVTPASLTVTAHNIEGQVIDAYTISRK